MLDDNPEPPLPACVEAPFAPTEPAPPPPPTEKLPVKLEPPLFP
jgi:hypothetical protein